MAQNVIHDHRVGKARGVAFDRWFENWLPEEEKRRAARRLPTGRPLTGDYLKSALTDYRKHRIIETTRSDLTDPALNGRNLVRALKPGTMLATVIDLNSLVPYLGAWLGPVPGKDDKAGVTRWLDVRLSTDPLARPRVKRPAGQVESFIKDVLVARSEQARGGYGRPTWAVPFEQLRSAVPGDADCCLCPVGVTHADDGIWFIVLAYPVERVPQLYRPTQLEGGWYPWHFPSPPRKWVASGGHPMDLCPGGASRLMSEYIHPYVEFEVDDWHAAGDRFAPVSRVADTTILADRRRRHHHLLIEKKGPAVARWMPDPT